MTIQSTIDAVDRLLNRRQAVPSKLIHYLLTDCKALLILTKQQDKKIKELESKIAETAAKKAEEK